jgi:hypothetical protein
MVILETIQIKDPDGIHAEIAINKDDFDPQVHELLDAPKRAKKKKVQPEFTEVAEPIEDVESTEPTEVAESIEDVEELEPDPEPKGFTPTKSRKRKGAE